MVGSSQAEEAFRVYAPGSRTQTLWVVDAVPKADRGLDLKLAEKPELGINGVPGKAVATVDEGKKEAHCILTSPDNKFLYVPYVKGNLALLQYGFNATTGAVTPLEPLDAKSWR